MRKIVAFIPILSIVALTLIASLLQSCGAINIDQSERPPVFMSFNKLDVALWILALTILIGSGFGYYLYRQITKLEDRIDQLKHSE